jgi:type II secretory pathway component PulM
VSAAEKYVAAAYGVFVMVVLLWVAIVATKLARLERETGELLGLARARAQEGADG